MIKIGSFYGVIQKIKMWAFFCDTVYQLTYVHVSWGWKLPTSFWFLCRNIWYFGMMLILMMMMMMMMMPVMLKAMTIVRDLLQTLSSSNHCTSLRVMSLMWIAKFDVNEGNRTLADKYVLFLNMLLSSPSRTLVWPFIFCPVLHTVNLSVGTQLHLTPFRTCSEYKTKWREL